MMDVTCEVIDLQNTSLPSSRSCNRPSAYTEIQNPAINFYVKNAFEFLIQNRSEGVDQFPGKSLCISVRLFEYVTGSIVTPH